MEVANYSLRIGFAGIGYLQVDEAEHCCTRAVAVRTEEMRRIRDRMKASLERVDDQETVAALCRMKAVETLEQ